MLFKSFSQRHVGVNFGKWLGWILMIFLVCFSSTTIDNVIGGDCVISGSQLYYLAGQVIKNEKSLQRRQVKNNSTSIFRRQFKSEEDFEYIISRHLDLKTGFKIQDGNAPWVSIGKDDIPGFKQASLMYPHIVSRGNNNTGILVFGGIGSKTNQELLGFDADAMQFYVNIKGSSFIKTYANSDPQSKRSSTPIYGTWVQNEEITTDFLLFGGIQLLDEREKNRLLTNIAAIDSNSIHSDNRVFKYSSINKAWSVEAGDGQPSFMHSTIVFKGKMIVFGGINPQTLKPYPWNQLRIYNIKSKTWETSEIKGQNFKPRFGHRAILVRETMIVIGGTIGNQNIQNPSELDFDDSILVLNLVTLKWTSVNSKGWRGSYMGCLSFYNDQLIYAFGITKNQSTQGKTYIINTKTWESTNFFSPLEPHTNYQLWFFLACGFLGLFIFLFIIGIFLHRCWQQKHPDPPRTSASSTPYSQEKPNSAGLRIPSPLNYFLWSNSAIYPGETEESVMTLTECSSENSLKTSVSRRVIEAHLSSLDNGHMNINNNNFSNHDLSNNIPIDVFFSNESNKEKISCVMRKPSTGTTQSYPTNDVFSPDTLLTNTQFDSKINSQSTTINPTSSLSSSQSRTLQRKPFLKLKSTCFLNELEKHEISPRSRYNSKNSETHSQFTILSAPFTPEFSFLMNNSPSLPLNVHPNSSAQKYCHTFSPSNPISSLRRVNSLHKLDSSTSIELPVRRKSIALCRESGQTKPTTNISSSSDILKKRFIKRTPSSETVSEGNVSFSSPEIEETEYLPSLTEFPISQNKLFSISPKENNSPQESSSLTTNSTTSSDQSTSSIDTLYSSSNSSSSI